MAAIDRENEVKVKFIEAIRDAAVGQILGTGAEYSHKTATRRSIDAAALRAKYHDIALECTKESTYRTLRRHVAKD